MSAEKEEQDFVHNFLRGVPDEPQLVWYTAQRRASSNSLIHMLPSTNKSVAGCSIISDASRQREGGTVQPVDA